MTLGIALLMDTQVVSIVFFLQTMLYFACVCVSLYYYFLSLLPKSKVTELIKWLINLKHLGLLANCMPSSLLLAWCALASCGELVTTSWFSRKSLKSNPSRS